MQKSIAITAVISAALAGLGATAMAGAADNATTTAVANTTPAAIGAPPAGRGPGGQRPDETPVTGSLKDKLVAAVEAKYGGATVDRVETDADGGGKYEAHVTTADGSRVTVFFDGDGTLTDTQDGMGPAPAPPADAPAANTDTSNA